MSNEFQGRIHAALDNAYENGYVGWLRDAPLEAIVDDLIRCDSDIERLVETHKPAYAALVPHVQSWRAKMLKEMG